MIQAISIQSIEEKQAKNGANYKIYTCNDGKYYLWLQHLFGKMEVGNTYEVDTQDNNGKVRIISIKNQLSGKPFPANTTAKNSSDAVIEELNKQQIQIQAVATSETPYKINVKKNSKGFTWDVTVRGETPEEVKLRLDKAIYIAQCKIVDLDGSVTDITDSTESEEAEE